jgi:hypothetical protein
LQRVGLSEQRIRNSNRRKTRRKAAAAAAAAAAASPLATQINTGNGTRLCLRALLRLAAAHPLKMNWSREMPLRGCSSAPLPSVGPPCCLTASDRDGMVLDRMNCPICQCSNTVRYYRDHRASEHEGLLRYTGTCGQHHRMLYGACSHHSPCTSSLKARSSHFHLCTCKREEPVATTSIRHRSTDTALFWYCSSSLLSWLASCLPKQILGRRRM